MPDLSVGVVFTPRSWGRRLRAHVLERFEPVCFRWIRGAADADLRAIDILVVDDDTSFLDRQFAASVAQRGIALVGIYETGPADPEGYGRTHLHRMGIETVVEGGAAPEEVLDVIRSAVLGGTTAGEERGNHAP